MKASEVMIGDWVHIDSQSRVPAHNDKVTKIFEKYCNTDNSFIGWEYVEPIPLTEDILVANGFEMKANNHYYIGELFKLSVQVALLDDGSVITITNDLEYRGVNNIHICDNGYVHILQHALRLCGLDDLADNFIIHQMCNNIR